MSKKNVIYLIDSGKGDLYNKVSRLTIPRIYAYAKKTNSDVVVVKDYGLSVVWDSRASKKFKTYYFCLQK